MTDFDPETIAQVATRLYNDVPGANVVPKTEPDAQSFPADAPQSLAGMGLPETSFAPSASSTPQSVPNSSPDGLRAFIQGIRTGHYRSDAGFRPGQERRDTWHGPVGAPSVPVEGSRPLDIPAIRRDFPALNQRVHGKPLAWLDNAATTQKPQTVIDALSNFYAHDNSNTPRGAHTPAARATDAYEQARQKVQTFLGAAPTKEIIFVRGTTEGINLIAQTYGRKFLHPGAEVVLSMLKHHASIVPSQMV